MVFQQVVQQYGDAFPPVGSRYGAGHRPARHFINGSTVAQVDSVTFVDNNDGTTLTVTIAGIATAFLDTAAVGASAVAQLFIDAINAHAQLSQIVHATLYAAGVMRLTARTSGTAFTATAAAAGGGATSTAVRAAVTANSVGEPVNAGDPMFRPINPASARTARLPAATTDIFLGLVQFRHMPAELGSLTLSTVNGYPAGSQLPVDPNGEHVVTPEEAVLPGNPVRVNISTNKLRTTDTGSTAQISTTTFTAVNSTLYALNFDVTNLNGSHSFYRATYTSDGSATATEIRDGIQASMVSLAIPITTVDLSTDGLTLTSDVAGASFTIAEDPTGSIAQATTTASAGGTILLANATWQTATAANAKGVVTYEVP